MSTARERVWVPTGDVRTGDLLAHKLSDTPWAYTEVTGWTDKVLHLGGSLGDVTHRRFTVASAPWWVTCDEASLSYSLDGEVLIMARAGEPAGDTTAKSTTAENEPAPVTRVILTDDFYGYRMPVPSAFSNDLLATDDDKRAVLESIGITRHDDVSPLAAWRDAVADESGIPKSDLDPARGGRLDLGFTPAYVRKFVLYLA